MKMNQPHSTTIDISLFVIPEEFDGNEFYKKLEHDFQDFIKFINENFSSLAKKDYIYNLEFL